MSAGGGGDSNQDFDLNLAPIIDCFTVLITYLLVSASFISLNALDVGVAVNGGADAAASNQVAPITLDVQLKAAHAMEVHLTGGKENLDLSLSIPSTKSGGWNLEELTRRLAASKAKYASLNEATVKAESAVQYKDIIKTVETLKKSVEKVYLSQ